MPEGPEFSTERVEAAKGCAYEASQGVASARDEQSKTSEELVDAYDALKREIIDSDDLTELERLAWLHARQMYKDGQGDMKTIANETISRLEEVDLALQQPDTMVLSFKAISFGGPFEFGFWKSGQQGLKLTDGKFDTKDLNLGLEFMDGVNIDDPGVSEYAGVGLSVKRLIESVKLNPSDLPDDHTSKISDQIYIGERTIGKLLHLLSCEDSSKFFQENRDHLIISLLKPAKHNGIDLVGISPDFDKRVGDIKNRQTELAVVSLVQNIYGGRDLSASAMDKRVNEFLKRDDVSTDRLDLLGVAKEDIIRNTIGYVKELDKKVINSLKTATGNASSAQN